ncbi:MAG: diguanylate cyclase [Paracoccaceae bacterium]
MTGRILLTAMAEDLRRRLARALEAGYFEVAEASRGGAPTRGIDLVIADAGPRGLGLCRALKADPSAQHLPVVMIAPRPARAARLAGLGAGADDILAPEIEADELSARLRRLLRSKAMLDALRLREETALELELPPPPGGWAGRWTEEPEPAGRLLVVGPAAGLRARELSRALGTPAEAAGAAEGLAAAERRAPELILLEIGGAAEATLRLIAHLRARPALRETGIVAVLEETALSATAPALDLGAADVAPAPPDPAELAARLRAELRRRRRGEALRAALRDGLMLAAQDPLTGLYNRRYAEPHLARLIAGCSEARRPLAVLMLDLDRFKEINDRLGHAAGDSVLKGVAARLRAETRAADLVARLGGEEFCIALPGATRPEAEAAAERLRAALAATPYVTPAGPVAATASLGVAMAEPAPEPEPARSGGVCVAAPAGFAEPAPALGRAPPLDAARAAALLADADSALYASKAGGRNRVTMAAA